MQAKLKNEEQGKEIQLLKEVNKNLERTLLDDKKGVELRNEKVISIQSRLNIRNISNT